MPGRKIIDIALDILKMMTEVFPRKHLDFMFAGLLDPGDVVEMTMLELIKAAYDKTEEKHSLRYFYDKYGVTEMDQIMRYSRIQSYVMKYRQREYDRRMKEDSRKIFDNIADLIPPDMSDMSNKLSGYKLTEMNFFELTTILGNEFTKAFSEHRITDSKKISNERFRSILGQYDDCMRRLHERWLLSDEDTVFSSLAAFTLEWKYPVNFIYSVARRMEELEIREFPDQRSRLATFCADINYRSMLHYAVSTHSRMLTVRNKYIDLMLMEPENSSLFEAEQLSLLEGLGIVAQIKSQITIEGMSITDWFIRNTSKRDWADFFREYNIFSCGCVQEKQWSNKTIRYFRECLNMLFI